MRAECAGQWETWQILPPPTTVAPAETDEARAAMDGPASRADAAVGTRSRMVVAGVAVTVDPGRTTAIAAVIAGRDTGETAVVTGTRIASPVATVARGVPGEMIAGRVGATRTGTTAGMTVMIVAAMTGAGRIAVMIGMTRVTTDVMKAMAVAIVTGTRTVARTSARRTARTSVMTIGMIVAMITGMTIMVTMLRSRRR